MEQKPKSECGSCRKKGESKFNWMTLIGLEVVLVSIYGHVKLVNLLIDYLSRLF